MGTEVCVCTLCWTDIRSIWELKLGVPKCTIGNLCIWYSTQLSQQLKTLCYCYTKYWITNWMRQKRLFIRRFSFWLHFIEIIYFVIVHHEKSTIHFVWLHCRAFILITFQQSHIFVLSSTVPFTFRLGYLLICVHIIHIPYLFVFIHFVHIKNFVVFITAHTYIELPSSSNIFLKSC